VPVCPLAHSACDGAQTAQPVHTYKAAMPRRALTWWAASLAALFLLPLLGALVLAVFGWNWARGPLQNVVLERTGRALEITGDLSLKLAWPRPRLRAAGVSFANPAWATAPQMLTAEAVEVSLDARELLRGRLAFPEVRLQRPHVFMEQAGNERKTWLLDKLQSDESARIPIGNLEVDQGEVNYVDRDNRTDLHAELATTAAGLAFKVLGRFRGEALAAQGSGGAVLAWRDEATPYPLKVTATLDRTKVEAEGTVTSLQRFSAVDLQLALRGDTLAALLPITGITLPPTPAYQLKGRLLRSGTQWRYADFSGQIGRSDIAGTLQVETAGARPVLTGSVSARSLDVADLLPAIGKRGAAAPSPRLLPDLPFDPARWAHLDADVALSAQTLVRAQALPLHRLQTRLRLQDRVLGLDPLAFELAGGQVQGLLRLDGRAVPLRGHLKLQLRGLNLALLLPKLDLGNASLGQLGGDAELSGQGASVGALLASADGRLSVVAQNGRISRLLMEQSGLHLLEILRLNLSGDQTVPMNCVVADFAATHGVLQARALVLDTTVNTVLGSGQVDLAQETLDLTFTPHTKVASVVALRSPIHLRGSLAHPVASVDGGRLAARGAGALLLGVLNPLLALIPLFDAGPGVESPCARLVQQARSALPKTGS
jgi:AsmA protein